MATDPTPPSTGDEDRAQPPDAQAAYAAAYAAVCAADPQGPDPDPHDEPIRTLLWTAATYRPLDEVAALVSLLKRTKAVSNPGDEALRAAAVARPLDEVRQLVALLTEPPHEVGEADTTLRAAAVGRPIEDVAQLVNILGTDASGAAAAGAGSAANDRGSVPERGSVPGRETQPSDRLTDGMPTGPAGPPPGLPSVDRPWSPAGSRGVPGGIGALARGAGDAATGPFRSPLRWPAATALLACGIIHLPTDLALLRSGGYADALSVAVTVLCLMLGLWLAVRDTALAWAAAAATAVGVIALHGVAGVSGLPLLRSSLGGAYAWASTVAVLVAASGAILAGSVLVLRQREPDATNST
ncbi:hypothetical protein [Streptomyces sp. SP18CS02]|uniref:hypothetical protein n=1 Tax=Streptomyces sp. SP18CS02 TaxID=3002531 RepID=UPI002E7995B6|nr:hypothetical protein [Streptomyces sp. SP18CS02]MEE1754663.1 hypothetical protein [Streptomyces sp. SP18CS02]